MGEFTFRWDHPASEVFVTGTFDNWSKSVKLDKKGDGFEKSVELPESEEKVLYKFVADGQWSHDHTAKTDTDHEGYVNNVLYPTDITPSAKTAAVSSVAPGASTTQMAGEQPLTKDMPVAEGAHEEVPGAFPETPAATANDDSKDFSVNPIPASSGAGNPVNTAPGDKVPDPSTFTDSTIQSNVRDDPSLKSSANDAEQTFGVAPLPATSGAGNPINLAPGEKVPDPSTFTSSTVDSNVRLDKESYEKSDTGAPVIPALSPGTEREAAGAPIFGLGPTEGNKIIPESSLPMGDKAVSEMSNTGPHISSAAPESTTAQLAGQQPVEPRGVPEVVNDSQEKAQTNPEASTNPEAVVEKREVENELKEKVPEEPSTSESGLLGKSEKSEETKGKVAGAVAGGVAAAGTAAAAGAFALRQKAQDTTGKDPVSVLPEGVQDSINNMNSKGTTAPIATVDKSKPLDTPTIPQQQALGEDVSVPAEQGVQSGPRDVPSEVVTSQKEARVDPEASANPEAVKEKSAMEKELKSEIPQSNATGEAAPTAAAGAASVAVPTEVTSSQQAAHVDPEAAANPEAVKEKSAMEQQLKSEVPPATTARDPAPTASAALSETAAAAAPTTSSGAPQLADPVADVSPISMTAPNSSAIETANRATAPPVAATSSTATERQVEGSKELNAPAGEPATVAQEQKLAAPETSTQQMMDSRDVSPMSKVATKDHPASSPVDAGAGQETPTVTTGVDSSAAPAQSEPSESASKPVGSRPAAAASTPQKRGSFMDRMKGTPESVRSESGSTTGAGEGSSKKRRSLFGRIKDKLKA